MMKQGEYLDEKLYSKADNNFTHLMNLTKLKKN